MSRTFLAAATCLLIVAASSEAAKVKVWQQNAPAHYDKAQLKNAVVSSEGTLRLSRQLKPLTGLDAAHVWDVIEDKDGALLAATGDEGKVYKVTADGKATILYKSEDSQILCLAAAADGSVYAGTGPSGQIVRIDPRGEAKVFCETGEGYVWSLAVDSKSQALYAGTGPKGRILRVTAEGKASVFYSTKQDHILCLATGADGTLYAGTDRGGLVYKIDAKGKGFVMYQAVQGEIRCLRVTNDAVYAGTSSPTKRHGGAVGSTSGGGSSTAALDLKDKDSGTADAKAPVSTKDAEKGSSSSESKESGKGGPAAAPSAPAVGENSVYRIGFDGGVREIFREKALILSILRDGNRLLIGTGMDGQLFEVDETTKERSELARLDHGQILGVLKKRDGSIVLAAGDPGKLYVMQDKFADQGTITSEVFDAKLVSKWGSLRWQAETPDGTSVRVAVRSGNVAEPDETWSDWSAEQTDGQQATVAAPAARFLQYRVTLVTTKPAETPALRSLALRYMTTNQAPEVSKLEVPDLNSVNLDNPKKLKIKWTATDANEDELTYSLYVKKDGWKNWVVLEDDLEKTEFEWDTTTTPSGIYQVKVVASDRKDNPDGEALTGERVSVPFVVCHTPPTVTVKTSGIDGDQVVIEAKSVSPLARITSASFAVNGKKWVNIFPEDGLFDSKEETFKFKTEGLKPGTYVLVVRVRDAAGNTGSGDVVFTVQPKK
jgi:outer membrane protein assembly factor BamB